MHDHEIRVRSCGMRVSTLRAELCTCQWDRHRHPQDPLAVLCGSRGRNRSFWNPSATDFIVDISTEFLKSCRLCLSRQPAGMAPTQHGMDEYTNLSRWSSQRGRKSELSWRRIPPVQRPSHPSNNLLGELWESLNLFVAAAIQFVKLLGVKDLRIRNNRATWYAPGRVNCSWRRQMSSHIGLSLSLRDPVPCQHCIPHRRPFCR